MTMCIARAAVSLTPPFPSTPLTHARGAAGGPSPPHPPPTPPSIVSLALPHVLSLCFGVRV